MRIVVALIDPRPLTRESLGRALEMQARNLRVLPLAEPEGIATLGIDATPTLVLLNIAGTPAAERGIARDIELIHAAIADIPVVVLSDSEAAEDIVAAVEQGARGYLPMSLELHIVIKALRLVAAGGTFVPAEPLLAHLSTASSPTIASNGERPGMNGSFNPVLTGFNPRQLAVVELLRHGKSNKAIAQELDLPEATVKVQVRQIMKRLGVTNRTQVALLLAR